MLKVSWRVGGGGWGGPAQELATLWNHRFLSTGSDNPGLGSVLLKAQLAKPSASAEGLEVSVSVAMGHRIPLTLDRRRPPRMMHSNQNNCNATHEREITGFAMLGRSLN